MTVALLGGIYYQIRTQLFHFDFKVIFHKGIKIYFFIALLMMPLNVLLEIFKWKLLVKSAQPVSFITAAKSYLAGLSLSILTPNRIGEYPGRILYLKRKNTPRLISVTFLGMFTQFLCLFIFGIAGLIYYNFAMPGYVAKLVLVVAVICMFIVSGIFFSFEKWSHYIERFVFFRRLNTYSQLLKKFTLKEQGIILGISMLRFAVYVTQYLFLLKWMGIGIPLLAGFCTACLFFFGMAVIPSIALAEMGIRGQLSILLFENFTSDKIGILVATLVLWIINLILPSIIGSLLWLKARLIK